MSCSINVIKSCLIFKYVYMFEAFNWIKNIAGLMKLRSNMNLVCIMKTLIEIISNRIVMSMMLGRKYSNAKYDKNRLNYVVSSFNDYNAVCGTWQPPSCNLI